MKTRLLMRRLRQAVVLLCGASLMFTNLTAYAGQIVTYVHTDRLGNPVAKTDSTGDVIWRQSYTPYGETDRQADPNGPGYTGHRHDAATGLVYMQARYYDPKIGRFLSPDPVTFSPDKPQFFNRYWYANGNPYRYTDPDGRCAICIAMGIGAVAGAAINIGAQLLHGNGSVNWKQVGVAAAAGALGGFAGSVASSAATTAGMIGANAVAGAAIGAGAVHASAAVEGKTATTAQVVTGALTGGALSAAAGAVTAAPGAIAGAASSTMTQTEKVATKNLLQGVANTTRSAGGQVDARAAGQGVANAAAEVISNADNLQAQPKDDLQNQ